LWTSIPVLCTTGAESVLRSVQANWLRRRCFRNGSQRKEVCGMTTNYRQNSNSGCELESSRAFRMTRRTKNRAPRRRAF
jgi:hypothetical protein